MSVIWPRPTWRPGWTGASRLLRVQEQCSTSAGRPRKPAAAVWCMSGSRRGGARVASSPPPQSPPTHTHLYPFFSTPPPTPAQLVSFPRCSTDPSLDWFLFLAALPLRFPASWLTEDNFQYHNQLETGVNIDQKLYRRGTCERAHTWDT